MEVGQLNIGADQVAPERQQNGKPPQSVPQTLDLSEPRRIERLQDPEESRRAGSELARALAEEVAGTPVEAPNELRLRVEDDLDFVVAKVVNSETEEVIREIPPEELVDAAKKLNAIIGQLLDKEA